MPSTENGTSSWGDAFSLAALVFMAAAAARRQHGRNNPVRPFHSISMDGKTIVVTGANTGLGKEAARQLTSMGAHVVLACRDIDKAEAAARHIRRGNPAASLEVQALDLSDLKSVGKFVNKFDGRPVHVLLNNAGMIAPDHRFQHGYFDSSGGETSYEKTFAVNHLGSFALTMGLIPSLKLAGSNHSVSTSKPEPSRVINVSSRLEKNGSLCFDTLVRDGSSRSKSYEPFEAYATSKLANILFTAELERRCRGANLPVVANTVSPGMIPGTELGRWANPLLRLVGAPLGWLLCGSPAEGALTMVWAASATEPIAETTDGEDTLDQDAGIAEERGGRFLAECEVKPSSAKSHDTAAAKALWKLSEQATGFSSTELGVAFEK